MQRLVRDIRLDHREPVCGCTAQTQSSVEGALAYGPRARHTGVAPEHVNTAKISVRKTEYTKQIYRSVRLHKSTASGSFAAHLALHTLQSHPNATCRRPVRAIATTSHQPPHTSLSLLFPTNSMEKERGKETIHLHPTRTAIASSSFRTEQVQICVRAPVRCFRAASNCYHPGPPSLLFEFFLFFCQIANKPFWGRLSDTASHFTCSRCPPGWLHSPELRA